MDPNTQETFWNAFAASPIIMMRLDNASGHAEPMTALLDEHAHHALWFFAARDNRITPGGPAMGQVISKNHEVFACLSGTISEENDTGRRDALWNNAVEACFPGGKTDPAVVLLRFDIADSEVWISEVGIKGAFKMATGRPIEPGEAGHHVLGAV